MALILGLEQKLAINHEPTVVIHYCYAVAWVQLIWRIYLSGSLHLKKIGDVDGVTAERVDVVALVLCLGIISGLEMITNFQVAVGVLVLSLIHI